MSGSIPRDRFSQFSVYPVPGRKEIGHEGTGFGLNHGLEIEVNLVITNFYRLPSKPTSGVKGILVGFM